MSNERQSSTTRNERALSVPCPACAAEVSRPCQGLDGWSHLQRIRVAEEARAVMQLPEEGAEWALLLLASEALLRGWDAGDRNTLLLDAVDGLRAAVKGVRDEC